MGLIVSLAGTTNGCKFLRNGLEDIRDSLTSGKKIRNEIMHIKQETNKFLIVSKKDESPKYWMSKGEYTNIIVKSEQTNHEYVITDGIIEPKGFVPDLLYNL